MASVLIVGAFSLKLLIPLKSFCEDFAKDKEDEMVVAALLQV